MDISLKILQSLSTSTQKLSNGGESRVEELIPLAVQAASSIIKSASGYGKQAERELEEVYKHIITESLTAVEELTLVSWFSCADPEGGWDSGSRPPPPPENHKNIGFLSNTGLDPLENNKITKPAFNVRPSSACQ